MAIPPLSAAPQPETAGSALTLRHQWITEEDIEGVVEVLRSDWITQGPKIQAFEERVAAYCGSRYGVAFSSGTAALHAACHAAGIEPGDEVITSPLTFVATANAVVYLGGRPVFADIDAATLTIDPEEIVRAITPRTKAVIPVHFAGLPCDLGRIAEMASRNGLMVIEDACHALGAQWRAADGPSAVGTSSPARSVPARSPEGRMERIGSCSHSDMTILSFHPVKHITTGEGGMVLTNRRDLVDILTAFRHHGIVRPAETPSTAEEPWASQMRFLGYNYRITDFQCALGLAQLERLDASLRRRRAIAARYRDALRDAAVIPQAGDGAERVHAWHLYVVQLVLERLRVDRRAVFLALQEAGIPVNVHYAPVYRHPFYQERFGYRSGLCPQAERYYERALTLPLAPRLSDEEVGRMIAIVHETLASFSR